MIKSAQTLWHRAYRSSPGSSKVGRRVQDGAGAQPVRTRRNATDSHRCRSGARLSRRRQFPAWTNETRCGGGTQAITDHVTGTLGLSVEEAAWGIHQVVNENMAAAAGFICSARPNSRALFHGCIWPERARHAWRYPSLRLPDIIDAVAAGVGSAFGMLCAPVAFEMAQSRTVMLNAVNWQISAQCSDNMITGAPNT